MASIEYQGIPQSLLYTGGTGTGKTYRAATFARVLSERYSTHDLGLVLIDPKRRGFAALGGLPHLLAPLIYRPSPTEAMLEYLSREVDRRIEGGGRVPLIVVFIDELADVVTMGGRKVEGPLTNLLTSGGRAGVFVVACTQRPEAAVIGSLVGLFPRRVHLGREPFQSETSPRLRHEFRTCAAELRGAGGV